jgi:beta-phosphoglucomutase
MKHPIKVVLFDLDGTLIDTEPSAVKTVKECFENWQIQVHPDDSKFVTGRTWESAFEYLFSRYTPPIPLLDAKKKILGRYRERLEEELFVVPGSAQAVTALSQNFALGLVSGSSRNDILWALDKLGIRHHFQVILGAEDYPHSKPSPVGYLKAIETLQAQPHQCLVFEDSFAGITSARNAGTWVVAVTSTNHFQQDLTQAHLKISDLQVVNSEWVHHLSFD